MGKRSINIDDSGGMDSQPGWLSELKLPEIPPARTPTGDINPKHYQVRLARVSMVAEAAATSGMAIPFNLESVSKMIEREASFAGIDTKTLTDARSDADKIRDAVDKLTDQPELIWEITDDEIKLLEDTIENRIIGPAQALMQKRAIGTLNEILDSRVAAGKAMLNRLRRARRLRIAAKNPFPKTELGLTDEMRYAWEATHVLRFMIYVSRSSTIKHRKSTTGQSYVYMIGPPHVMFAVDTWIARTGVMFTKGKMIVGGCRPKKGVMLIAPPGHGKSDFASHYLALEIDLNPSTQSMYVHAVSEKAEEQVGYIAAMFKKEHSSGRRNQSLFGLTLDKKDNNQKRMRVKLAKKTKSPTITAYGMTAAALGGDTTFQVFDDIVPQSDVDQPTERERRFRLLSGTFATRQRGQDTFKIFIGTLWHHADALSQTWKAALKNDTLVLSKQTTGGPRPGKKGVFEPLWPEVYPASELSRRFDEMKRNYAIWSANYMGDPVSDEMRLIRKLKLYDPTSDTHTQFLSSAVFHLSCDPAATSKESSDKAGIIYAGVGEVPVVVQDKSGTETVAYHRRLRILDYRQIHASQTDLADAVANYANSRPVYQVHVETRGGYHATADIMENKYGVECVRHDPKSQSKEIRLKQCAGVMDAGLDGMDPVVEFPGITGPNGEVVPNEEHRHLYQQFLDFGFAEEDHLLDCTTQLVNYLLKSGDLVAGSTAATISTRKFLPSQGDPRVKAMLDYWAQPKPDSSKTQADWDFINNEGSGHGYN